MKSMSLRIVAIAVPVLLLAACGEPRPPAEMPAEPAASTAAPAPAALPRTPAPAGAAVSIKSPPDGAVVSSPVKMEFDVTGMALAPAGDATPDTGHHHLLIDVPLPDLGQVIPKDEQHVHFGQAQATAEITLPPGQHTLQLLLGDSNHVPHDPPVLSPPITITVQ